MRKKGILLATIIFVLTGCNSHIASSLLSEIENNQNNSSQSNQNRIEENQNNEQKDNDDEDNQDDTNKGENSTNHQDDQNNNGNNNSDVDDNTNNDSSNNEDNNNNNNNNNNNVIDDDSNQGEDNNPNQTDDQVDNNTGENNQEENPLENKIVVTFQLNEYDKLEKEYEKNQVITNLPVASKVGATFLGWWSEPDGKGFEIKEGLNIEQDTKIFARWIATEKVLIVENGESIQGAIDESQDGDYIFIKPGIYQENLTIDKSITLLGNNYLEQDVLLEETIITPVSGEKFNFQQGVISLKITCKDVTISGLTFNGDNPYYQNIWNEVKQKQFENIGSASPTWEATKNYLSNFIDKDVNVDGSIAILATKEEKEIGNLTIKNNIIKNYVEYGVLINNGLNSNPTSPYADDITVENNKIENILGIALLSEDLNGVKYVGGFGRAISMSQGVSGRLISNHISNSTLAIEYYYNFKGQKEVLIEENKMIDCDSGIWINTTGLSQSVDVLNNQIVLTANYHKPEFRSDDMSYGIAITGTDSGLLTVAGNQIQNYKYSISVGSTRTETILIKGNHFIDSQVAIAIPQTIFGYDFKNSSTYLSVDSDNNYQNCQSIYEITELNINKFAKITFIDDQNTLSTILKGKLLTPTIKLASDKKKVTWAAITNAESYNIYINDQLYANQTTTSFELPIELENINLTVQALAGLEFEFVEDSLISNQLNLVRIEKVEKIITSTTVSSQTNTIIFEIIGANNLDKVLLTTKNGYTYTGWKDENGLDIDLETTIAESGIYYVEWLKNYTVKYYIEDQLIFTQTVPATEMVDILEFDLEGNSIIGWYTNKTLKDNTLYSSQVCEKNLVLYGKISPIQQQ